MFEPGQIQGCPCTAGEPESGYFRADRDAEMGGSSLGETGVKDSGKREPWMRCGELGWAVGDGQRGRVMPPAELLHDHA